MRLVKLINFIDEQKQQGIFSQNMLLLKNFDSSKPKPFFEEWFGVAKFLDTRERKEKKNRFVEKKSQISKTCCLNSHWTFAFCSNELSVQFNWILKSFILIFPFFSALHKDDKTKHLNRAKLNIFSSYPVSIWHFSGFFTPAWHKAIFQCLLIFHPTILRNASW